MLDNFPVFAKAVRDRFNELAKDQLFIVDSDRDAIWAAYMTAFPAGSNPIFRVRSEHDCSCCRHFIRDIGNVVAIQNGALASVWDLNALPYPYQDVADVMSAYVKSLAVRDVFLVPFGKYGVEKNHALLDGKTIQFNHFCVETPCQFKSSDFVAKRGAKRTTFGVLKRGLEELKVEALGTVADLIEENALYRGAEHQRAVMEFRQLQARIAGITDPKQRELIIWQLVDQPIARFRNTVIGTLVQDLSDGVELDVAVRSFETKVAPQNYKRPTALITKGMVEAAMAKIAELDLEPALERRHARLSDVSVNDVLFVDNAVRGEMKGGLKDLLMQEVKPAPFDPKNAEEIDITDFVGKLPAFTGLQVYLDNSLLNHFMSLTAPVHADAKPLFRWDNNLAWSYDGNVTDSLRQKVVALGGRVDGALRFSHTWNYDTDHPNQSLMDLHVFMPGNEHHADRRGSDNHGEYYGVGRRVGWNQRQDYSSGGVQDVDHVNPPGEFVPVENIAFPDIRRMPEGKYIFKIHNWNLRQPTRSGFKAEIEFGGQVFFYEHAKPLKHKEWVTLAEVVLHKGVFTIKHVHPTSVDSSEKWGLKTLNLVRVNSVVLSPNFWEERAVGNKHWFFILDGCQNPLPTRGIYNEFLHPRLEAHRKVFEVLGEKTKCPVATDQLSGVGFSSTRKDKVVVVATGPTLNKVYNIHFGKE